VHGYWAQFVTVAIAHMLAVASPGPDFAMVVRQSIAHGRRAAIWTSIGIGTAILVHVTYALLGIGLLIRASHFWFTALKIVGAVYLAWIGIKAFRSRPRSEMAAAPAGSEAELSSPAEPSPRAAWVTGFLTNAFNPKVTLFFVAIFATLIAPSTPKWMQAAYGAWMSLATMAWFSMVSMFITRDEIRRAFLRGGHWIDRAMGVVLIGLAVVLALASVN
jgi:RhtB (resistance to homoserine/threonine) family protein